MTEATGGGGGRAESERRIIEKSLAVELGGSLATANFREVILCEGGSCATF